VTLWDPDVGGVENAGTQWAEPGLAKVNTVAAACDRIRPGHAIGVPSDIRQIGIGELLRFDVLLDCSDDPSLAMYMTQVSNGLQRPLLRLAVDGSGDADVGRVLCSHGGAGHSCQLCTYDVPDLFRRTRRTPCPNQQPERPPTLAGGPIAAAIGACGLLQAQRLVTGNDMDQVLDLEVVLDLTDWQLFPIRRPRSAGCLSGHTPWQLTRCEHAAETTLAKVFHEAEERCGAAEVALEPFGHPLFTEALCECGGCQRAVGTRWAPPPICAQCGKPMTWFPTSAKPRLTRADATLWGIEGTSLTQLGFPQRGALFTAHSVNRPPLWLLLHQDHDGT
jgi:hypothetical protein